MDYTLTPPVSETKQVAEVSNPLVENTAKNAVAKAVAKATKEAMNAIVIATAGVNLRAEPSVESEKLDTLKKFAQFKAEPHNDTWSKATYGDKVGYVMTKYVRIDEAAKKYLDEQKKLVANMEKELARLKALTSIQ